MTSFQIRSGLLPSCRAFGFPLPSCRAFGFPLHSISLQVLPVSPIHFNRQAVKGVMAAALPVSTTGFVPVIKGENDYSAETIIMEPIFQQDDDVAVIFAPGAFTAAEEYIPLCKEIQSNASLRLWIAILNPKDSVISEEITEGSFEGVLGMLKSRGFRAGQLAMDNVFVAGHSWGAWTARSIALRRAQGFIQLGSCFPINVDDLAQYPKPVLTVTGERDAQVTLAPIVKHAGEIVEVETELGEANTYRVKPVILVQGMNHAQFSHGIPNKDRGDLDAEISLEEARSITGGLIGAFLEVQVSKSPSKCNLAVSKLEENVKNTHLYRPYWEAIRDQGNVERSKQIQVYIAGANVGKNISVVQHDFVDNFIYSKPTIEASGKIVISTFLNPYGKYGIIRSLWIKMKSKEAVHETLGIEVGEKTDEQDLMRTAATMNKKVFDEALQLVSETSRMKYLSHGRKLRFSLNDDKKETSLDWISSDVVIKPATDGTEFSDVQSPVLLTGLEMPPRFAGMHYMKLLTLAGAMQWILTDCYRP